MRRIVSSAISRHPAQSVAAIIGQGSLYHAYHPYTDRIKTRDHCASKDTMSIIVLPVEVMVELAGGEVVEAGYANGCSAEQMEMMITDNTEHCFISEPSHSTKKYADSR